MKTKARMIALYLPQFFPTKINDYYWGKGFTEWRNVTKARPLFRGHYQPRLPADLGFYDLRLEETSIAQADMARAYGIEGFCYWHYWFGNKKMILNEPLERVVKNKRPDFPFCIGWANHSWSNKTWEKTGRFSKEVVFLEQTYPGKQDLIDHFYYLLPMFCDERYITVDGKPLIVIFEPGDIPDNKYMINLWNELAVKEGLKGLHFVARQALIGLHIKKKLQIPWNEVENNIRKRLESGYDAIYNLPYGWTHFGGTSKGLFRINAIRDRLHINTSLKRYDYKKMIPYMFTKVDRQDCIYPQLMPHWDNTPRSGKAGYVYINESPENWGKAVDLAIQHVKDKKPEHRIVFIHSWNEWGEGAYLEPDLKYGLKYLEALRDRVVCDED